MDKPVVFTTSGTVQAQDGTYLTRQADAELFQLCRRGEYAYILTSRQMGKSSLMVATAERLQAEEGVQTAIVDLQRLGAQTTTADKWYFGLLTELARKLRLLPELMTWWEAHGALGEAQRLVQFLEDVVLPQVPERLVVFIDEIDSTLSLGFTDDFFIALRSCFTARAENADFERLSFVLLGVATPSELIADQKRTPFNIGSLVELKDFALPEALPLAAGFGLPTAEAQQVLGWILKWTEGHPYLTQRVCEAVVQQPRPAWTEAAVDGLIGELFFGERREQDNNLQFVQSMLTGRAPESDVLGVLGIYRAVQQGRQPVYDEDQSILKAHLKLAGIVKRVGTVLRVRNPIYAQVFDLRWIREQWPESWWERLKPAMPLIAGLTGGGGAVGGLVGVCLGAAECGPGPSSAGR
ncbi:MAG: AAA-like domain-containing protein [Nodosilinea sp.]